MTTLLECVTMTSKEKIGSYEHFKKYYPKSTINKKQFQILKKHYEVKL